MDGENPDVRTCSNCHVKKELDKCVRKNLARERCLKRKKQYRANNPDQVKERNQRYKENGEQIKAKRKEYTKNGIDCEFCECKVKKCRWKKQIETRKHKNN